MPPPMPPSMPRKIAPKHQNAPFEYFIVFWPAVFFGIFDGNSGSGHLDAQIASNFKSHFTRLRVDGGVRQGLGSWEGRGGVGSGQGRPAQKQRVGPFLQGSQVQK